MQGAQAGIKRRLVISSSVVQVPAPARRLAKPVHDGHPHPLFRHGVREEFVQPSLIKLAQSGQKPDGRFTQLATAGTQHCHHGKIGEI